MSNQIPKQVQDFLGQTLGELKQLLPSSYRMTLVVRQTSTASNATNSTLLTEDDPDEVIRCIREISDAVDMTGGAGTVLKLN